MKRVTTLIFVLLSFSLIAIRLNADDSANPPAAGEAATEENPAAPEAPPNDGAVNARDMEIKAFLDTLAAIEKKATDLRAAVNEAATPVQIAQARQIDKEVEDFRAAKQTFINRWLNWLEFEDYSKGLPNDKTARFGNRGCRPAIGDFNEDGKPDLAAVSCDSDSFYVWLNNGDGTWKESRLTPPNNPHFMGGIALTADFNGDGRLDLLFAMPNQPLYEYKGDGKGNWEAVDTALQDAFIVGDIQCADIDGDKDIDVVISIRPQGQDANAANSPTCKIVMLENDGTGKFTQKDLGLPSDVMVNPGAFMLVDINNDGKVDFINPVPYIPPNPNPNPNNAPRPANLSVWLNQGNNTWVLAPQIPTFDRDTQFNAMACADVNGDGLPDLIGVLGSMGVFGERRKPGEESKTLQIFLNGGQGPWKQVSVETKQPDFVAVEVADITCDGNQDIILLTRQPGKMTILIGDGKGGFKENRGALPSVEQGSVCLKACDMDADGAIDVVAYYVTPVGPASLLPDSLRTFRIWRNSSVYPQILHRIDSIKKILAEIK